MKQLILASQSPRRKEILEKAGYQFASYPVYVSEIPNKNLSLDEQILDIAGRKAEAVLQELKARSGEQNNKVILTADTMVCYGAEALGKPENEEMAFEFLRLLSGKKHQVKTALCLVDLSTEEKLSHIETTHVYFKNLTDGEIKNYIATGEPMDKAGAYAIQGLGSKFVEKFEGDFNNVVGLPLHALEKLFTLKGWIFQRTLNGL
ncbi:MAG: maf protein [Pseudobdellovibrio sp.]|jgi:septum formation protein|nr:maf protein [Pseudobdellovibrio sp.]